jgi:hypothetical protein
MAEPIWQSSTTTTPSKNVPGRGINMLRPMYLGILGILALIVAFSATVPNCLGSIEGSNYTYCHQAEDGVAFYLPAQVLLTLAIIIALHRRFGGSLVLTICLIASVPLTIFLSFMNYHEKIYPYDSQIDWPQSRSYSRGVPFRTFKGYQTDDAYIARVHPMSAAFAPSYEKQYYASYISNYLILLLALYLVVGSATATFRAVKE